MKIQQLINITDRHKDDDSEVRTDLNVIITIIMTEDLYSASSRSSTREALPLC